MTVTGIDLEDTPTAKAIPHTTLRLKWAYDFPGF